MTVEHGDADLEFGDLSIEIARHEASTRQLHAVHLRLDAAPAVVSGQTPPEESAQVLRRPQSFVSSCGADGVRILWLRIPAGRNDGNGTAVGDRIVARAGIIGAVGVRSGSRKPIPSFAAICPIRSSNTFGAPLEPVAGRPSLSPTWMHAVHRLIRTDGNRR